MQMSNICVLLTLFLFSVTWRPLLGTDGIHPDLQTTPVLWNLSCPHLNGVFCVAGELLSQPRPEGLTEIVCPKNGSERVNVALVYPPMPTMLSPSLKWPGNVDCGLLASPNPGPLPLQCILPSLLHLTASCSLQPAPPTPTSFAVQHCWLVNYNVSLHVIA